MRILVMGTGGVGGYYGGVLANAGHDVTFVARGAQLEALQARGLEVRTQGRTIRVQPARAVGVPTDAGDVDLALFTVKTYDTETAARALAPAVGPRTNVLTLQNGIDSVDILSRIIGAERILAGVTLVASGVVEPGVIQENGFSRKIVFGEPSGGTSERVQSLERTLREAGLDVEASTNARQAIWDKFVLLAPHASISALAQTPIGVTRETPEAMELYRTMIAEVKAVGEASGMSFAPDVADTIVGNFMTAPPGQTSSMQRDYAAQRRVELEYITGTVVRRARQLGVATPAFDALYAILKVRARTFGGID
jgi:2-dehydropantoate 2-reductase